MKPEAHLYDPRVDNIRVLAPGLSDVADNHGTEELVGPGVRVDPAQAGSPGAPFYVMLTQESWSNGGVLSLTDAQLEHLFAGLLVWQSIELDSSDLLAAFDRQADVYASNTHYAYKADPQAMGAYTHARSTGATVSQALQAVLALGPAHSQTGRVALLVKLHQENEADAAAALTASDPTPIADAFRTTAQDLWNRAGLSGPITYAAPARKSLSNQAILSAFGAPRLNPALFVLSRSPAKKAALAFASTLGVFALAGVAWKVLR